MDYIIRDHDRAKFERRKELFSQAAGFLNQKYGSGTVEAAVKDSYYNMKEKIEPHMDLIDKARASMEKLGIRQSWYRSGEHGRRQTVIYGAALSEPVYRRP